MAEKDKVNGARSYKGQIVGSDSFSLTINVKWLLQVFAFVLGIAYTLYQYQMKIQQMSDDLVEHKEHISKLMDIHQQEENVRIAQLETDVEWYKKELNLNPLSIFNKKRGKK